MKTIIRNGRLFSMCCLDTNLVFCRHKTYAILFLHSFLSPTGEYSWCTFIIKCVWLQIIYPIFALYQSPTKPCRLRSQAGSLQEFVDAVPFVARQSTPSFPWFPDVNRLEQISILEIWLELIFWIQPAIVCIQKFHVKTSQTLFSITPVFL